MVRPLVSFWRGAKLAGFGEAGRGHPTGQGFNPPIICTINALGSFFRESTAKLLFEEGDVRYAGYLVPLRKGD